MYLSAVAVSELQFELDPKASPGRVVSLQLSVSGQRVWLPGGSPNGCTVPSHYLVQAVCGQMLVYLDEKPCETSEASSGKCEVIWRRDDAGKLVLTERVSGVFTSTGDGIADPMCTLQNCAKDGVVQVLLGKHILPLVGEFTALPCAALDDIPTPSSPSPCLSPMPFRGANTKTTSLFRTKTRQQSRSRSRTLNRATAKTASYDKPK
jgi:hypothetical protein